MDFGINLVAPVDDLLVRTKVRHKGVEADLIFAAGFQAENQGIGRSLENLLEHGGGIAVLPLERLVLQLDFFRTDRDQDFLGRRGEVGGG